MKSSFWVLFLLHIGLWNASSVHYSSSDFAWDIEKQTKYNLFSPHWTLGCKFNAFSLWHIHFRFKDVKSRFTKWFLTWSWHQCPQTPKSSVQILPQIVKALKRRAHSNALATPPTPFDNGKTNHQRGVPGPTHYPSHIPQTPTFWLSLLPPGSGESFSLDTARGSVRPWQPRGPQVPRVARRDLRQLPQDGGQKIRQGAVARRGYEMIRR
jgi:hypothetical protein